MVVGKVIGVEIVEFRVIHTIEVLDGLKKARVGDQLIVETGIADSCGFSFQKDSIALVLASYKGEVLWAYLCSNLNSTDASEIALGKRRAWWWRSPLSSFTFSALRWR